MRRREGRLSLVGWGVVTVLVVLALGYLGATKSIPFVGDDYEIEAAFRDSSGIKPGSPVRIAGVDVGEVSGVERVGSANGRPAAVVKMKIKDSGRPVHQDATAKIRPRIFLEGNFYVDLEPGSPDAGEFDEGATIPVERTANPVQLGEVLKALKRDTRASLQTTVKELARAHETGAASAFRRTLPDQEVAYRYAAIVSEALLGERSGDLSRFLREQGAVSGALGQDRRALRDLITNFNTTFAALADREGDLRAAVDELPTTLRVALPTLQGLNDAFPRVRRFARAALPAVRSTGPTVDAALPLVRQLRGLVSEEELRGLSGDLRAAVPALSQVAQQSLPVLEELRLLSSCTTEVIAPFADSRVPDQHFPATGPVYQEFPKSVAGLAGESRSHDANGSWFKVLGQGGVETLELGNGLFTTVAAPLRGAQPAPQFEVPPLRPEVPCETQEPPNLESRVQSPPAAKKINRNSPAVKRRSEKARAVAIELQRRQLRAQGSKVKVLDRDATLRDVTAVARKLGLEDQLKRLQAKVRAGGG